jgi:hypothetical protein
MFTMVRVAHEVSGLVSKLSKGMVIDLLPLTYESTTE